MRYTRGFSVVNWLTLIVVVIVGTWGISKFAFEREYDSARTKAPTQSYVTWWEQVRTVTWATYRDTEFRFALRYPSNWVLKKVPNDSGFPTWYIGQGSDVNARVHIRYGSPQCVPSTSNAIVAFGEKLFSVCDLEDGQNLWYLTEFARGKEVYVLSCRYGMPLKNCYNFFFSFSLIP